MCHAPARPSRPTLVHLPRSFRRKTKRGSVGRRDVGPNLVRPGAPAGSAQIMGSSFSEGRRTAPGDFTSRRGQGAHALLVVGMRGYFPPPGRKDKPRPHNARQKAKCKKGKFVAPTLVLQKVCGSSCPLDYQEATKKPHSSLSFDFSLCPLCALWRRPLSPARRFEKRSPQRAQGPRRRVARTCFPMSAAFMFGASRRDGKSRAKVKRQKSVAPTRVLQKVCGS